MSPTVAGLVLCITKCYKLKIVEVYAQQQHHTQKTQTASTTTSLRLGKPNHFNAQNREKNKPYGTLWKRQWANLGSNWETKERRLGRMGNIKKVQNHEYYIPEESREEMDMEEPKYCNEDRNWLHPNKQARHHHRHNSHQPSQHWKWPQTGYEQHQTRRRKERKKCMTKRLQE